MPVASLYPPIDPASASSVHPFRVRFCETDLMGIVHHANYLVYFEAGRVEWLRRRGVTYADWARSGLHLPVVEAELRYKSPARFDEELEITTTLVEARSYSIRFAFSLRREKVLLAEGNVRLACVDDRQKLRRLDDSMVSVLYSREISADPGLLPR